MPTLTIEELGGQRRTLALSGAGLPFAGTLGLRSRLRIVSEQYGDATEQQVLGEDLPDSPMSGTWRLPALAADSSAVVWDGASVSDPAEAAAALDSLLAAAEVVRVSYARWIRYGRVSSVELTPARGDDVDWSVSFSWLRADRADLVVGFAPTPEDVPAGYVRALNAALDGIGWFEDLAASGATTIQDVLDVVVRGPLAVVTAGGTALQTAVAAISGAVDGIAEAVQSYQSAALTYTAAIQRLGGLSSRIGTSSSDASASVAALSAETAAATDEPIAQMASAIELASTRELLARVDGYSVDVSEAARAESASYADDLAVHVVREGETLVDVARAKYGDPDRWVDIAQHNGSAGPWVAPGTEVVIP